MMAGDDRDKWNSRYRGGGGEGGKPAEVLAGNLHLLPPRGKALDLACGLGGNALQLAGAGLDVSAWDISEVALNKLGAAAAGLRLHLRLEQRDVVLDPPAPGSFDVIVVARFLDRGIIPAIIEALKADGLVYYQTYLRDKQDDAGPSRPEYLLGTNELLKLFDSLTILYYREDGRSGDTRRGNRNEAMLVAKKA